MSIRPSYFLIEVTSNEFPSSSPSSSSTSSSTISSSSKPSNGPQRNEIVQMKAFFVVHLMQIITNRINEIYNDTVSFRKDAKTILKGRVVAASTTRDYIEYKKRKLLHEQKNSLIYNHNFYQYFLIKYRRNQKNQIDEKHRMDQNAIMFTIVPQSRVSWIVSGQLSGQLHLDTGIYEANVLLAHDSEEFLLNELQKLKQFCALSSYSEIISGKTCGNEKQMRGGNIVEIENIWLLVQYCLRPTHVAYDIVNYNQTIHRQQNPHKDLLAYLPYGEDIIHSIIIRRSFVRTELEEVLRHIEEFTSDLEFPLKEMTPLKNEMATGTTVSNGSNGMDYTKASPAPSTVICSTLNGSATVATNIV